MYWRIVVRGGARIFNNGIENLKNETHEPTYGDSTFSIYTYKII